MSSSDEYSDDEEAPPPTTFDIEEQLLSPKYEKAKLVRVLESGENLNYGFLVDTGFDHPMLFKNHTGLGMKLPDKKYGLNTARIDDIKLHF